jgi:hypothetical protein
MEHIMPSIDLSRLRMILLDVIIKKQSVKAAFARVYENIGLPLIAFDVSFSVIAFSFPRPFYYSHWESMVSRGHATEDAVTENSYLQYQEMMYSNGKSQVFDWGTSEGYPQAAGPIMQDGRLIGYVGIMLEGVDAESALCANDMLADVISLLMRSDRTQDFRGMSEESLAELVLFGSGISSELKTFFTDKYRPPYVLAVISSQKSGVSTLQ